MSRLGRGKVLLEAWLLCFSDLQLEPQYLSGVFVIHATEEERACSSSQLSGHFITEGSQGSRVSDAGPEAMVMQEHCLLLPASWLVLHGLLSCLLSLVHPTATCPGMTPSNSDRLHQSAIKKLPYGSGSQPP